MNRKQGIFCVDSFFAQSIFPHEIIALPEGWEMLNAPGDPLPENCSKANFILGGWGMPQLDTELLNSLPNLEAIFYSGGSVRSFMTPEAWRRNLTLCTGVNINAACVAEYCLAVVIFSLKHGWRLADDCRVHKRFQFDRGSMPGVFRAKIGLVSFGRIARRLCQLLRPLPVSIHVWDPFTSVETIRAAGAEPSDLESIFSECDVVSIHTPLLEETKGLIGRHHLSKLRAGATLINTARGEIIAATELEEALSSRPEIHAVLDVTHPEPPEPTSKLYALPNVVLTPHLAGCSGRECRRLGEAMFEELWSWSRGDRLNHQLDENEAKRDA